MFKYDVGSTPWTSSRRLALRGEVSLMCRMRYISSKKLTNLPARVLAAGQIVHVHVRLAQALDCGLRVAPQAPGNCVGDDAEALTKLVNEAEAELALDDGRPHEEDPGCFRGLIFSSQQRRAREAARPRVVRLCGNQISGAAVGGMRRIFTG